ncbi:MAG: hypothetical protein LJE95_03740 [Acidobacteria bacterium]|nr:hypothetical protein [Acidobacteriota bacterium]
MNRLEKHLFSLSALACAILLLPGAAAAQTAPVPPVPESVTSNAVTWATTADWASARLTVLGPNGFVLLRTFQPGDSLELGLADLGARSVADGSYTYELRFAPRVDSDTSARLAAARDAGDVAQTIQELRHEGALPAAPLVRSGALRVVDGSFALRDLTEDTGAKSQGLSTDLGTTSTAAPNQVISDNLEVQGSECVGIDCTSSESFGFDTVRLKENNTRLAFNDTSNTGSFPTEDWRLRANESANGGRNAFFIDDMGTTSNGGDTPVRTPFTVEAGAPTNSLYVNSGGRLGVGTSAPVMRIQATYGDTPGVRLDQTGSLGYSPQVWDVAGNEANFFVRDVTHSSNLPFRIRPGAPTSSIDIAASGDVGIGTQAPASKLDVAGDAHVSGSALVDGNVGIGTSSPAAMLDVNGDAHVNGDTHIGGNVGIGTSTPSATLDVVGTAHVAGNIVQDPGATIDGQDLSHFEAGVIPASAFSSLGVRPPYYRATVKLPIQLANYTVAITPVTTNLTEAYRVISKSSDGFVVGTDSTSGLTEIDWQVRPVTSVKLPG